VERWQQTGRLPSPIMLWTPDQTGQFLDHAADHVAIADDPHGHRASQAAVASLGRELQLFR
jgi:hypothetical protein